jgi:putative photosynthetic complex assembly protein 2
VSGGVLACLGTVLGWWLGTGIILWLNHLPRQTYRWSLALATALLLLVLWSLPALSQDTSGRGLALAFVAALVIWGWLELSYLTGFVTGPRAAPCPATASAWQRFQLGVQTSLYHELSMLALVALSFALTRDAPNQVTAWSCVILWLLRWSAKLNLFLGVSNFNEHWLPERLSYLGSYMRRRPMNGLVPLSLLAGGVAWALLLGTALAAPQGFERHSLLLLTSLLGLGVLEHAFLMLPVRDSSLWQWALPAAGSVPAPRLSEEDRGHPSRGQGASKW